MNLSVSKGSGQFGDSITVSWQTTQDGGTLSITDGQNTQDITGQASGSVTWTLNGPKGGKQVYHCTQQGDTPIDEAYASVDILADEAAAAPQASSADDPNAAPQASSGDPQPAATEPQAAAAAHTITLDAKPSSGHVGDGITVTWSAPNYSSGDGELWITDGPGQTEKNISGQPNGSDSSWALNGPRGGKQYYHCFQKKDGVVTDEAFASVDILDDATGDNVSDTPDGAAGQTSGIAASAPQFTSVKFSLDPDDGNAGSLNTHSLQVRSDAQITLDWDTINATGVRIDTLPVSSPLGTSGSIVIPTHDASYSIVPVGNDGDGPAWPLDIHTHDPAEVVSQHIDLSSGGPQLTLDAQPTSGKVGDDCTISWTMTPPDAGGTLSLTDGQQTVDVTGQSQVVWKLNAAPGAQQFYHLTHLNDSKTADAEAFAKAVDVLDGDGDAAGDKPSIEISAVLKDWTHKFSIVEEGPIEVSIELSFTLTGGSVVFEPSAAFGKDQAPDHLDDLKKAVESSSDVSPFVKKESYQVEPGGGIAKPSVEMTTDGVSLKASWTLGHMGDAEVSLEFTLLSLEKGKDGKLTAGALTTELGVKKSWTALTLPVANGVTVTQLGVELSISAVADPNWTQIAEYVGETLGVEGVIAIGFVVVGVAAIAVYIDAIETVAMWDTIPGQVSAFAQTYSSNYLSGLEGALTLHDTGNDQSSKDAQSANAAGRQMSESMITKLGFRDKAQDWWTQNKSAVTSQVNATALANAQTAIWTKMGPGEDWQTQKGTWLRIFGVCPKDAKQLDLFLKYADKSGDQSANQWFLSGAW